MPKTLVKKTSEPPTKTKTPSKSQDKEVAKAPFDLMAYFKGVRLEWQRITWPRREQVLAETGIVLIVVVAFCAFVFAVDKIFQFLIQLLTNSLGG